MKRLHMRTIQRKVDLENNMTCVDPIHVIRPKARVTAKQSINHLDSLYHAESHYHSKTKCIMQRLYLTTC